MKTRKVYGLVLILISSVVLTTACGGEKGGGGRNKLLPGPEPVVIVAIGEAGIAGQVTDSNGNPINGINVRVVDAANPNIQVAVVSGMNGDLDGSYRINHLPAGQYRVLIEMLDGRGVDLTPDKIDGLYEAYYPEMDIADQYYKISTDGSTGADSDEVTLTDGTITEDIDFVVEVPIDKHYFSTLDSSDTVTVDNRYYESYEVRIDTSASVTFQLIPHDFDGVLILRNAAGTDLISVDDYYNDREKFKYDLEAQATYTLIVTSYREFETGTYDLSIFE